MSGKVTVNQNNESRFMIAHHDSNTDEVKLFGGFFNEVENIGTEDEVQIWEQEKWVDSADVAMQFRTLSEAKDALNAIGSVNPKNCKIVLCGYCETLNASGDHWFPLKQFPS